MKLFSVMATSFDNFDMTVKSYLAKTFNSLGLQYSHSQIFGVIFDGIKGIMQNMMIYIEDALTEQNIFKASRKTSVYSLAKISGFEAFYGAAATGNIVIKQNKTQNAYSKIYIKHGTEIINKMTGMKYSICLPSDYYIVDLSKPLLSHQVKIVQGTFNKSTYVSRGNNLETIHVTSLELFDKDYIIVKVNGEKWDPVPSLYDMIPGGKQYLISIGYDNAFDITFGNNVFGNKLTPGSNISVEYLKHGGASGNIFVNDHSDFLFVDKVFDLNGNSLDANEYFKIQLKTGVSGGCNSDTIALIRNMIGNNSRSLVLASEDNFKLFFKRFSCVGYVNCWSELNSMIITTTCLKNFSSLIKTPQDYFKLKNKDLLLSDKEKEMIKTTLSNSKKSFAGITLKFKDPIIRRYAFICYIKTENIYDQEIISLNIKETLAKYFIKMLENTQFIAKSDIIKHCLDNVPNINALEIDIISELAEQTFYNNYYEEYSLEYINGTYDYVAKKIIYEPQSTPGIDNYGNIKLNSKLEVPVLQGNFRYYYDKENNNKNNFVNVETIQVLFI
jgi:hypothetical protein